MATYQILRWGDIPVGVKAIDEAGQARDQMPERFQNAVDAVATATGRATAEEYLAGWVWEDPVERAGEARAVAQAVIAELEQDHPAERLRQIKAEMIERFQAEDQPQPAAPPSRDREGAPK